MLSPGISFQKHYLALEPVVSEGLSGLPPLESCQKIWVEKKPCCIIAHVWTEYFCRDKIHTCNLRSCSIGRTPVPLLLWLLRYQGPLTSLWLVIVVSTIPRNGGVHGALRRRCASAGAATRVLRHGRCVNGVGRVLVKEGD